VQPVLRAVVVLVVVAACLLALLWAGQRHLVFLPSGGPLPAADSAVPGAQDVVLTTSDGLRLGAWHVPAAPDRPTVLVAPGNAGDRQARAPLARALSDRGLGVLLMDYRGYGGNPGSPSEEGLRRDVRAARDFLLVEADVEPERLLYLGESLGAAVVADLAREHPPTALVLRSPFTSLADVGVVHYPFLPVRLLLKDRFAVAEAVAEVDVPVVVVLGTRDSIVPPEQSRAVADAAAGPTQVVEVEGAGHNDRSLLDGPQLVRAVTAAAGR
jgi:uncharacterized protein